MALIVWLQALEPHALWHLVFAMLSWCGDGPLYILLFPLLYWRKAPAVAILYGYVVGLAVLLLTIVKAQTTTLRPFLAAPAQVAFLSRKMALSVGTLNQYAVSVESASATGKLVQVSASG